MRQRVLGMARVVRGRNTEKRSLFVCLWQDDRGALLAVEWVVLATVMVLGLIPGLVAVRQGVLTELLDMANAALGLDQSYGFTGQETGCGAGSTNALRAAVRGNDRALNAALHVGAGDTQGNKGPLGPRNPGGIQAYSAGSGFLESRHPDQTDGIVNRSTPATSSIKQNTACD